MGVSLNNKSTHSKINLKGLKRQSQSSISVWGPNTSQKLRECGEETPISLKTTADLCY